MSASRRLCGLPVKKGKKPFDLSEGPLLRPMLVRLDPEKHFLVLVIHHIVTDGWSIALLFREVTKIYAALTKNETPELPELTLQYAEYAQWQREYMSGDLLKGEIEHWKHKLARSANFARSAHRSSAPQQL